MARPRSRCSARKPNSRRNPRCADVAWYHAHYYSTKAPGLALLTAGPYSRMHGLGVVHLAGNGTPEQFRQIHENVIKTSPNYFNVSQPVRLDAKLEVES